MGKGTSSALGILALLIGIGGLAFGIYSYFVLNQSIDSLQGDVNDLEDITDELSVHRTYSDSESTDYIPPSEASDYEIPNLDITFIVDSGESVYFIFTCRATLTPTHAVSQLHFWIKIDGVRVDESQTTVGATGYGSSNNYYSVALQYTDSSITSGNHDVVVETRRDCAATIDNCYLFVQTYRS